MSATVTPQQTDAHVPTGPSRGAPRRRRPQHRNRQPNQSNNQQDGQTSGQTTSNQPHTHAARQVIAQHNARLPAIASAEPSSAEASATENIAPRRGRHGRGGRGGGQQRGGGHTTGRQEGQDGQNQRRQRAPPRAAAGGRQFGGDLTVDNEDTVSVNGSVTSNTRSRLQAQATEFQPGQPLVQRPKGPPVNPRQPQQRQRRPSKSSAPDISTRTHEDINNGWYECAICTEEVRRNSRVWSCRTCWTVFHLGCIKKWSTREGSAAARQQAQDGELPPPRQWRCPGCNLPKDALPKMFTCWCEKEIDPKSSHGLPPFSCGQTCARERVLPKKCPHPCPNMCHSGPCPPCSQMGPTQLCFCGKKSITRRCVDTDYEHGWSCGEVCGELMPCGEHACERPCHEGLCGACEVRIPARCYCGQVQKEILCCDRGDEEESSLSHDAEDGTTVTEHWTGLFECGNACDRPFDCGKHHCEKTCHPQDAEPSHCPRSPDVVSSCPCGKTALSEISDHVRQTCEDAIPNCSKACGKTLGCGHECTQICHQGECAPCLRKVSINCRCGRTTTQTICHQGTEEPPQCMRVCRVTLNCGRHECGERCCPGEKKAAQRQASRRKGRPLDAAPRQRDDNYEAEHICTRPCGRQLKCRNPDHRCEELCHKGACGSCREAIFDEINCNCGRTVLQPPLPCGTQPPPCRFQCGRPKSCGHPQVAHTCHLDNESCPKCPFLTTKPCLCTKNTLKNQPCWLDEVRCGEVCGARLKCGAHKCQKQCHRPGECQEPCRQPCGKELATCGHACLDPCHSPFPCKEEKPCQHKTFITCECQRIKQEAKCGASKSSNGNLKKTLKCDEECARLERNRKLALALNIDPETHKDDHVPYSAETLKMYLENSTWAAIQEKELRLFAADFAGKRLRFKPMPAHQRAFLHSLAEDFGFDTESMDPEPHRHVAVFKTPRFVMAPMKTLAECARIRATQRPIAAATTAAPQIRPKANNVGDPYNGFLLTNPRFALTIEEIHSVIKTALPNPPLPLDIEFLPSEEVAFRPPLTARASFRDDRDLQATLESMQSALSESFTANSLGKLQLCRFDHSLNVLRKESDSGPGAGWSQVAAKGAPAKRVNQSAPIGNKGRFTVLSLSSMKKKKEKQKTEEVVDDWETAELMEEERERGLSAANSGDEGRVGSDQEGGITSGDENAEGPQAADSDVGAGSAGSGSSSAVSMSTKPYEGKWADLDDA